MATYTPVRLAGPAQLSTSATAIYTAPASTTTVIKQIIINNTSASAVAVSAYVLPVSATASAANAIISSLTVAPNSQLIWAADIPITAGEKLSMLAATGSVMTYVVSGIEIV
ncbi:hypothetical protein UFOVP225_50 [uncultured Caudovirales phage]|uniref:Uncharacterized protein n=1 Tax=uncultured Caudovirales phage TaxID=2100421 RepID=A0A6J5L9Z5_9CAUD|nr:hypothetical protein UFOVP113_63 [uncultured Caudovirales phage]CAB5219284.1 hypothetical protein UFOVP225_50 [uncultured Caudovirales phage]